MRGGAGIGIPASQSKNSSTIQKTVSSSQSTCHLPTRRSKSLREPTLKSRGWSYTPQRWLNRKGSRPSIRRGPNGRNTLLKRTNSEKPWASQQAGPTAMMHPMHPRTTTPSTRTLCSYRLRTMWPCRASRATSRRCLRRRGSYALLGGTLINFSEPFQNLNISYS